MNQPPNDPFSHAPGENGSYAPRSRPGQAPGSSQQPSSPGYPHQPQNQGPASQPGFSQSDNPFAQRPMSQPGFAPQGNPFAQGPISQPGFSPQNNPFAQGSMSQPGFAQGPASQPGFAPQSNNPFAQGAMSQSGFSSQNYSQQGSAPAYPGQRPSSFATSAPSQGPASSPGQPAQNFQSTGSSSPSQGQEARSIPFPQPNVTQPPQSPKKSKKGFTVLVSIVVVLALIIAGAGTLFALHLRSTVQTKTTSTTQGTSAVTATAPASTVPAGGNTGALNQPLQAGTNWVMTVTHVTTTTTSDFPPPAGSTYLEITLTLKNTSATPQMVASLLQFTLSGANGKPYTEAAAIQKDSNIHQTPDGTVNSGQTLSAQLSYMVPQSQHAFVLSFAYDLIQGGSSIVTWQLSV